VQDRSHDLWLVFHISESFHVRLESLRHHPIKVLYLTDASNSEYLLYDPCNSTSSASWKIVSCYGKRFGLSFDGHTLRFEVSQKDIEAPDCNTWGGGRDHQPIFVIVRLSEQIMEIDPCPICKRIDDVQLL